LSPDLSCYVLRLPESRRFLARVAPAGTLEQVARAEGSEGTPYEPLRRHRDEGFSSDGNELIKSSVGQRGYAEQLQTVIR